MTELVGTQTNKRYQMKDMDKTLLNYLWGYQNIMEYM